MLANQPLVCICIPTYNAEETIKEMLLTVIGQTFNNFKVIVIDNASIDNTVGIINSIKDDRVVVYVNDNNIGASRNFDRCIELSDCKYTEIFHADEVYEKDILEKQVAVLESSPEVGVVFTEASLIDADGNFFGETKVAQYVGQPKGITVKLGFEQIFPAVLRNGNFLLCSGAMVRTEIYQLEIRCFDTDKFSTSSDLDVWLRISENHVVAIILEKLMRTRTSQTQASFSELKRNINRADMFLVLDFYLEKYSSKGIVSDQDISYYKALQRMDTSRRAMNMYLTGRNMDSSALLRNIPVWDIFRFSLYSKRGLLTFLLIIYLKTMLALHLDVVGVRILQSIAKKTMR